MKESAPTEAEALPNSETSVTDCCSPISHAFVLRTLEVDGTNDKDIEAILPLARAMLATTVDAATVGTIPTSRAEELPSSTWWWAA